MTFKRTLIGLLIICCSSVVEGQDTLSFYSNHQAEVYLLKGNKFILKVFGFGVVGTGRCLFNGKYTLTSDSLILERRITLKHPRTLIVDTSHRLEKVRIVTNKKHKIKRTISFKNDTAVIDLLPYSKDYSVLKYSDRTSTVNPFGCSFQLPGEADTTTQVISIIYVGSTKSKSVVIPFHSPKEISYRMAFLLSEDGIQVNPFFYSFTQQVLKKDERFAQ